MPEFAYQLKKAAHPIRKRLDKIAFDADRSRRASRLRRDADRLRKKARDAAEASGATILGLADSGIDLGPDLLAIVEEIRATRTELAQHEETIAAIEAEVWTEPPAPEPQRLPTLDLDLSPLLQSGGAPSEDTVHEAAPPPAAGIFSRSKTGSKEKHRESEDVLPEGNQILRAFIDDLAKLRESRAAPGEPSESASVDRQAPDLGAGLAPLPAAESASGLAEDLERRLAELSLPSTEGGSEEDEGQP